MRTDKIIEAIESALLDLEKEQEVLRRALDHLKKQEPTEVTKEPIKPRKWNVAVSTPGGTQILWALSKNGSLTAREIMKAAKLTANQFYPRMRSLLDEGRVTKTGKKPHGRYSMAATK